MARSEPKIYDLKPAKSIAQAVSRANAHVKAVHSDAGNASTSGAGTTIVKGSGKK